MRMVAEKTFVLGAEVPGRVPDAQVGVTGMRGGEGGELAGAARGSEQAAQSGAARPTGAAVGGTGEFLVGEGDDRGMAGEPVAVGGLGDPGETGIGQRNDLQGSRITPGLRSGVRDSPAEAMGKRRRVVGGARCATENVNASTTPLGTRQSGSP